MTVAVAYAAEKSYLLDCKDLPALSCSLKSHEPMFLRRPARSAFLRFCRVCVHASIHRENSTDGLRLQSLPGVAWRLVLYNASMGQDHLRQAQRDRLTIRRMSPGKTWPSGNIKKEDTRALSVDRLRQVICPSLNPSRCRSSRLSGAYSRGEWLPLADEEPVCFYTDRADDVRSTAPLDTRREARSLESLQD